MEPEGDKREPKGRQLEPKGRPKEGKWSQREPRVSQRAAKGSQKGAKGEPKDNQNASTNLPSEKVAKKMKKRRAQEDEKAPFWEPFSVKNRCKN